MKIIGAAEVVGMFPPGKLVGVEGIIAFCRRRNVRCSESRALTYLREVADEDGAFDEDTFAQWLRFRRLPQPVRADLVDAPIDDRWVYFVSCTPGPIKIGVAQDTTDRLSSLQTASPFRLELIARMRGGYAVEEALHKHFAAARLIGEWFEATPELVGLAKQVNAYSWGRRVPLEIDEGEES